MNRDELEQYLDIENVDISLDLFAAALAVEHITLLMVRGGNHSCLSDPNTALHPHVLEAFLERAVAAAQKTQRFVGEWRRLQRLFPRMKLAWDQGEQLFQDDRARVTSHQEVLVWCC